MGGARTGGPRAASASEALANTIGGYPVGLAIGVAVLPASAGWLERDPLAASAAVTAVYAAASFARSYALRRAFAGSRALARIGDGGAGRLAAALARLGGRRAGRKGAAGRP